MIVELHYVKCTHIRGESLKRYISELIIAVFEHEIMVIFALFFISGHPLFLLLLKSRRKLENVKNRKQNSAAPN